MNYKTVKVLGADVPVFETEDSKEVFYIGVDRYGDSSFSNFASCESYFNGEHVKLKSTWQPKECERVLFLYRNIISFGNYSECPLGVWAGGNFVMTDDMAKYDPSKPVPETWEEVEKSGEVLEV